MNEKVDNANAASANSPEPTLNQQEQSLRVEELRLKVEALKKPEYKKITTWTGLLAIMVAISGIIAQGILYQIKSAKAQKELEAVEANKIAADIEAKRLTKTRDSLKIVVEGLDSSIAQNTRILEQLSDKVTLAEHSGSQGELQILQQDINAAAIDLRASTTSSKTSIVPVKPLNTVIEELFHPKASVRGAAYNQLMTYHANKPELVPALLAYANNHLDNQNGIYNTLVVLGHLDYKKVPRDVQAIRTFAEQTRNNGPKTADRAGKVLQRLPK